MSLEISEVVSDAMDIVLLTFILVWRERQGERSKTIEIFDPDTYMVVSPLPVDD